MSRRSKKTTFSRTAATPRSKSIVLAAENRPAGLNNRWLVLGVCVFLATTTWLVFGQTLGHRFVNFDDFDYVLKNPHVMGGFMRDEFAWAFSAGYAANWHPLTWFSHMLDCQLYGLNPRGHHLTNVVLHAANAVLLFLVLRQMTASLWRSAFVAAVFAIHPLRVESVAWVAERKDVLSAFFFLLTLGAYAWYTRRPSLRRYGLVLVLFTLGLMSKSMLVTAPIILLLLDYWPLRRPFNNFAKGMSQPQIWRRLFLEKVPLIILAAAVSLATLWAQKGALQPIAYWPFPVRIANALISCMVYLRQMFWPADLAIFYPLDPSVVTLASTLFSLAILIIISVGVFWARRRPYLLVGWFWYLVMLMPVIGIIQVGIQAHADRYTYLPQIGLYLLLTWAAAELLSGWGTHRVLVGALAGGTVAALALSARTQASCWRDSETLWKQAIARTTDNAVAHVNLGEALLENGKLREAIAEYETAMSINAMQPLAHSALGVAFLEAGQPEQSILHLEAALKIAPNFAEAHYNLGNTFLQTGQAREAIEHYRKALELNPEDLEAQNNLAWLLATSPRPEIRDGPKAVELAERADSLTHGASPIVAATLAAAYAESGRFAEAVKTARRAANLATARGQTERAAINLRQLALYESGSAFRDRR